METSLFAEEAIQCLLAVLQTFLLFLWLLLDYLLVRHCLLVLLTIWHELVHVVVAVSFLGESIKEGFVLDLALKDQ